MDKESSRIAHNALWEHLADLRMFLDDESVQEVMINSPRDIWIEQLGVMKKVDVELADEQVDASIRILTSLNDKNSLSAEPAPIIDCKLSGLRVAAARPPVAVRGASMCIRKHSARKLTIDDYYKSGAFDPLETTRVDGKQRVPDEMKEALRHGGAAMLDFLKWAIRSKKTVLISGSTSSGKTTFIAALLDLIPETDRAIIIEDTSELAELHFDLPNRVHFEANEGKGVSVRDLVKLSLRYRPTRIIAGEVRGHEAFDVMNAYGTGHPGGLLSLHADNATQALVSFETKVRMSQDAKEIPLPVLRQQIASTFHYVIHAANVIGTVPPRAPVEIIEVQDVCANGYYQTESLYSRFLSS